MTRRWQIGGWIALAVAGWALSGCSTVRLEARPNIPQPVITKIPVSVGLFLPIEFSSYVYKGDRYGFKWEVTMGAAQSEGVTRLFAAMFDNVVPIDNIATAASTAPGIRAILEPAVEDFSFVTPRDAGTQFYAVSIKYRVSVYTPDGRLAESWPFTGYGIVPAAGMSAEKPLARATALAMRDAAAKLVVEFRDQAIVRGLLPDAARPDTLGSAAAPGIAAAEATTGAPVADSSAGASAPSTQGNEPTATPSDPPAAPADPGVSSSSP
jgi:hypothetical protein